MRKSDRGPATRPNSGRKASLRSGRGGGAARVAVIAGLDVRLGGISAAVRVPSAEHLVKKHEELSHRRLGSAHRLGRQRIVLQILRLDCVAKLFLVVNSSKILQRVVHSGGDGRLAGMPNEHDAGGLEDLDKGEG